MTALPLDRFRTIGLDDLVARAEMLTRIDRKYLLTPTEAGEFLNRLTPSTEALSIDGSLAASYETVYFDTSDWASFRNCCSFTTRISGMSLAAMARFSFSL